MIIISIAKNQSDQGRGWENIGAAKYLGDYEEVEDNTIRNSFLSIINNEEKLSAMQKIFYVNV